MGQSLVCVTGSSTFKGAPSLQSIVNFPVVGIGSCRYRGVERALPLLITSQAVRLPLSRYCIGSVCR